MLKVCETEGWFGVCPLCSAVLAELVQDPECTGCNFQTPLLSQVPSACLDSSHRHSSKDLCKIRNADIGLFVLELLCCWNTGPNKLTACLICSLPRLKRDGSGE
jgi:hypothetical protein